MHIALCRLRCCNLSIVSIYHNFTDSHGRKLGHSIVDSYLVCGKRDCAIMFAMACRGRTACWNKMQIGMGGGGEGGGAGRELNFYNNKYCNKSFVV